MLRLFNRVTLGAVGKDGNTSTASAAAANLADEDNQEILNESNPDEFALHHFNNVEAATVAGGGAIIVNDIDLDPEQYHHCINKEEENDEEEESSEDSESEIEEVSADLRENLLVNRRHKRNNYTNRVLLNRNGRHKRRQMRLTSRKRHVVASSNGSQLSYHHPTIQAKQNQMYLITTLLPNQQNQNQQDLINHTLPKEQLLRIFSYLDIVSLCRCAQVCRYWNTLAMDGSNWKQVDLFNFQKDIKASVVESLAQRCGGFLKDLSLRGCENIQDSALRSFATKCPNIERLQLNKCKRVTDDTSEFLGLYCHRLVTLDLENCIQITDRTLKFIGTGCKYLEDLNISWCQNVTDKGIQLIAEHCLYLKTFVCEGCEGITSGCFSNLNEDSLAQLRVLNLMSCTNITDETVEDISQHCHVLEYLCLSNCREITDRSLIAISQGSPYLKDLELALCSGLTDAGFVQLAKNCHELERMDLEDCNQITDSTLHNLNIGCPQLSSLSLSHCELLTDNGLSEFCGTHRDIIQVLELDNCPLITDAAFEFMKPMKILERVDLYDCQNITKDAIKKFKQYRPDVEIQAYFAPITPPTAAQPSRQGICRCCTIL
jgi:F-box/leucine-rich repeat protein 2/20